MSEINHALLPLWNLSPSDPEWLVLLALHVSEYLPKVALVFAGACFVAGAGRWRSMAVQMVVAMAVAWLVARGVQAHFPLPRPFVLGVGHQWGTHSPSPGFPSTHGSVALAFGFVGLLSSPRRWVGVACFTGGLMIAWSRVAIGVHFPMDIIAGAVLAALVALGVHWIWVSRARAMRLPSSSVQRTSIQLSQGVD